MKQILFLTSWGNCDPFALGQDGFRAELPKFLDRIKALGYSGVEMPVAFVMAFGSKAFQALLQDKGMQWVAQVFSSGPPPVPSNVPGAVSDFGIEHPTDNSADLHDLTTHQRVWAAQVQEALQLKSVLRSITSHTGRDYFTAAEADAMFSFCTAFEAEHGATVNHETHRGRILYSPWVMSRILEAHPALHLCADLSHFSCVAESGPEEPEINKVVRQLAPRVRHIHARVGFPEGPQVPDPRGAAWAPFLTGYKVWWRIIYEGAKAAGAADFSTTPEFGPAIPGGYGWTDPFTDKPVADVWAVNNFIGKEMCALFKEHIDAEGAGNVTEEK